MQIGFHFDQTRCTACFTCIVACKDWHDVPAGPASWLRLKTMEKGQYPDLFVANLAVPCYHCAEPACVSACPVNAISKRPEDGVVVVDSDLCLGKDKCDTCRQVCPYGSPQFGAEENAKMQKCDLCLDRWSENKKPICIDACPMRALDAGPIDELRAKYGASHEAEGFVYSKDLQPSIVFKPKMDNKGLPLKKVILTPQSARQ
ncbi:MAG: 4Fe-4S dicluster domain-containing protein [Chloroflexi bacterium]|nr:4Fe-4S dicluster domain-containing protein [Chloroflexota bacterium]